MIPLESDTPTQTLAEQVGLVGRSFLKELDFEIAEWHRLLDFTKWLKIHHHAGTEPRLLEGRNIALVFSKESTRTRCAFEVAAHTQGAHVTYLDPNGSQLGHKESLRDTGAVLGRMFDGIEYRGFAQEKADELARAAGVPVWNGLSDQWHPTQALCDSLTMLEHCDKPARDITIAYLGDAHNNVANSLLVTGAMMGFDVRMVAPVTRWNDASVVRSAQAIARTTGARISQTTDVAAGVAGADFIYTDVWLSMGEHESLWDDRIRLFRPYRVTTGVMKATGNPDAKFMHCLPALHDRETEIGSQIYRRTGLDGVEVTNEVFRSTHSIVFDQAENRLHTIKSILVATLGS